MIKTDYCGKFKSRGYHDVYEIHLFLCVNNNKQCTVYRSSDCSINCEDSEEAIMFFGVQGKKLSREVIMMSEPQALGENAGSFGWHKYFRKKKVLLLNSESPVSKAAKFWRNLVRNMSRIMSSCSAFHSGQVRN
jgi:hypothetical protein